MNDQSSYGVIYKGTCQIDGKVYIGQTTDLKERLSVHEKRGRYVDHHNHLYNAIKKHGWAAFVWEVIDQADSAQSLDEREIHWISLLKSDQRECGYNILPGGKCRKHAQETCLKISESNKRAIAEGRKPRDFPPLTRDQIQKRIDTVKEGYASGRLVHWGAGKPRTDEDRVALSRAATKHAVRCVDTGVEYESVKAAGVASGANPRKIALAAKGKQKTAGGYQWTYVHPESNRIVKGPTCSEEARKLSSERNRGKMPANARKVLCVETGEIFPSLAAAARSVGSTPSPICKAIKRGSRYIHHWRYV